MSFILDALKKSESSRQQHTGPAFAEVPTGRRHSPRPWWALLVAALLVVNLVVLAVVLLRDSRPVEHTTPAVALPTPADATPPSSPPAPIATAAQPGAGANAGAGHADPLPAESVTTPTDSPPNAAAAVTPDATADLVRDPAVRSLAEEAFAGELAPGEPSETGSPEAPDVSAAAAVPAGPPAVRSLDTTPAAATQPSYPENLPTVNELALQGAPGLPEMHLDIHVYSTNPAERFVFINLQKYVEGQTLKEGPTVERITRDGVVLNNRGMRFVLPRQ